MPARRITVLAIGVASVVLLASCSTDAGSPAATSTPSAATTTPLTTPTTTPTTTPVATETPPVTAGPVAAGPVAAAPVTAANPCAGNKARQAVLVRLEVQHLWLCERDRLVRDTPITSGIPGEYTSTPTGRYTVQALTRNTSLTLISGKSYAVKYWIPFDGPLFGFHDSSWQEIPYGSQKYRSDGSHGCIHMPLSSIRFLYRWADVGTQVRIRA